MSHHLLRPTLDSRAETRALISDLYVFPKPGGRQVDPVMNVHPSAVVNPPGPTSAEPFSPEALYEIRIDNRRRCRRGRHIRGAFLLPRRWVANRDSAPLRGRPGRREGDSGQVIVEAAAVSIGRNARVTGRRSLPVFRGLAQRSLFFDVHGILNDFQFTGDDFFATKTCVASCWKCPTLTRDQAGQPVGMHADRCGRRLGPGGSRRAACAGCLPRRHRERRLLQANCR